MYYYTYFYVLISLFNSNNFYSNLSNYACKYATVASNY